MFLQKNGKVFNALQASLENLGFIKDFAAYLSPANCSNRASASHVARVKLYVTIQVIFNLGVRLRSIVTHK